MHRRRLDGQVLAAPHVQQLRRVVAVANRSPMQAATVLPNLQHRRGPLRCGPVDGQISGGHDAAQCGVHHGVGRLAFLPANLRLIGGDASTVRWQRRSRVRACIPRCPSPSQHQGAQGVSRLRAATPTRRSSPIGNRKGRHARTIGRASTIRARSTGCPAVPSLRERTPLPAVRHGNIPRLSTNCTLVA